MLPNVDTNLQAEEKDDVIVIELNKLWLRWYIYSTSQHILD